MNLGPAPDFDLPGRPMTPRERVLDCLGCVVCAVLGGVFLVLVL